MKKFFLFSFLLVTFVTNFLNAQKNSCPDWIGNCNPDDEIYREGTVIIGHTTPTLPSKLFVLNARNFPQLSENEIPDPYTGGGIFGMVSGGSSVMGYTRGGVGILGYQDLGLKGGYAGFFFGNVRVHNGVFSLSKSGESNVQYDFVSSQSDLQIQSNGKTLATLDQNSRLQIGRLDASDIIYSREIKVKLPPFPDYVFGETYKLMPMKALQEYINKNRHLPNLPSAEEIKQNNIGLGELATKQMEKIEELTLYILQLNERIERLEKNLNEKK